MNKYENGKLYMIYSLDSPVVLPYYGSTIESIPRRKSKHKSKYNCFIRGTSKGYYTCFDIIKRGNWDIGQIENYRCENLKELEAREGYYIENTPCVNKCIPGRDKLEVGREYWLTIKNKRNEFRRQKINCPYCNKLISRGGLTKHKKQTCKNKPINYSKSSSDSTDDC